MLSLIPHYTLDQPNCENKLHNPRPNRVSLFYRMAALIAALFDITVLSIYARPLSTSWLLYLVFATLPMDLSIVHHDNNSGVYFCIYVPVLST